jgi:REP element-mobilizing transposase RayT
MATVGIHLIWTTYGTWLPGDDRGHWSPLLDCYGSIVEAGGKLNREDLTTLEIARELMKEPPKILDAEEQSIVAAKLGDIVRHHQYCIYAAAIEPTHVHLLLGPLAESIGVVAGRLKGQTSSALRDLPRNHGRQRTWTAKYWKVFLFDELALARVNKYIEDHNLRRGLGASPFDWLRPR